MSDILIVGPEKYHVKTRGQKITVERCEYESLGAWVVTVDNSSARAWGNGHPSWRFFPSLEEVEKKYKILKGLVQLHRAFEECEPLPIQ